MLYAVIACLLIIIIFLAVKLYLLKKTAREITASFEEILNEDTNTGIRISGRDKDMRELTDSINKQLIELRKQYLQYNLGNSELKNAITNMSHDIRTPLTAIYGYLDMIENTDDPEKKLKYISIIRERTEIMKQLTEELFQYSMVVTDDKELELEDVFVNQVLEESISSFYPALTEKNIVPDINICSEKIYRRLNKQALFRIFANLLNNAVKYSDGDLKIKLLPTGEMVFENTAKALSSVKTEQLFDRFFTVKTSSNSTGLGLSIAKNLVERMNGNITADYKDNMLKINIWF
ncbi:MAG: HAMP domain-containing histidine kinase [Lachnospiraceae bacterium]|nr:HAMP domain-containing histidine kinase [Lachnospiraceae bacterium]